MRVAYQLENTRDTRDTCAKPNFWLFRNDITHAFCHKVRPLSEVLTVFTGLLVSWIPVGLKFKLALAIVKFYVLEVAVFVVYLYWYCIL